MYSRELVQTGLNTFFLFLPLFLIIKKQYAVQKTEADGINHILIVEKTTEPAAARMSFFFLAITGAANWQKSYDARSNARPRRLQNVELFTFFAVDQFRNPLRRLT